MSTSDIDELIEELKADPVTTQKVEQPKTILTPDTIEAFILEKASRLITNGLASIEELKDCIQQGIDSEEILAYSDLIKSTTGAIETINKINLLNKKAKTALELKDRDMEIRKNLPPHQTNILIATREEIIKQLTMQARADVAKEPVHATIVDETDPIIDIEPES